MPNSESKIIPETQLLEEFTKLREKILQQIEEDTERRIQNNPTPTEDEIMMGAFVEMLEPQVRRAILEMQRKGYATESSGFGKDASWQAVDGWFRIDDDTIKKLNNIGVNVQTQESEIHNNTFTDIEFKPTEANLTKIEASWKKIADILPDLGKKAGPAFSRGCETFRDKYLPRQKNEEIKKMVLERIKELKSPKK